MSSTSEPATARGQDPTGAVALVLAALMVGGTLVMLVQRATRPLTNTDTFFHLRFGEEFLSGWSPRDPGSVSTFATSDWLPTQWLSQVVMAQAEAWFGLPGVAWWAGLQYLLLAAVVYVACRRQAAPSIAAPVLLVPLVASLPALSARPQVISYAFVGLTVTAWLSTVRDGRLRWWLVPVTWLWAMLHGMWPIGIAMSVAAALGLTLDRTHPTAVRRRAWLIPLLSAVVAALTPAGPGLYGAVLGVGQRSEFFSEWQPARFTEHTWPLLLVMFLAVLAIRLRRPPTSWVEVLFVLGAVVGMVYSVRTVPAAAVILAPILAGALQSLVGPFIRAGRREWIALGAAVTVALACVVVLATPERVDPRASDVADRTLEALPPGTPVLGDWVVSGYLMWRHPHLDLVMHGYGDTFTIEELERNTGIMELAPGWREDVIATGATLAVLPGDQRLAAELVADHGWTVLEEDEHIQLLQAPADWPTSAG